MSRRAAIYSRGVAVDVATIHQLRKVANQRDWTVTEIYVDRQRTRGREWAKLARIIARGDVDLLMVSSFSVIADTVSDAVKETLKLRDARCDLYVADAELDTTSPVDRVLFRVVEALRSIDDGVPDRPQPRGKPRKARPEPTPGQRSLIRAALATGMRPPQVAKSIKVSLALVKAVQASEKR